jgi:N-acyl-D-aspartate/D-glutamate deacylase
MGPAAHLPRTRRKQWPDVHDLVIRGGTVFDGTGAPGVRADVAVTGGIVTEVGTVGDSADVVIDAQDLFVSPGFIDAHTHMDAQLFWDPIPRNIASYGVTSAIMGNCGFTIAPGTLDNADLTLRSIERAEDMSRNAILAGVPWTWTTFAEYLEAVDATPKALNYGAYVGHSALRAFVMGERAFDEEASEDDLAAMARELTDGMAAGAMGFSTSRSRNHLTFSDQPVASRRAAWSEIECLVMTMARSGTGIFQLAPERSADPEEHHDFCERMKQLLGEARRPGMAMTGTDLSYTDGINDREHGAVFTSQMHVRGVSNIFSFQGLWPFDKTPRWAELRRLPSAEQRAALRDLDRRRALIESAEQGPYDPDLGAARPPVYEMMRLVGEAPDAPTIADRAQAAGVSGAELMIRLLVDSDFTQCFVQNINDYDEGRILTALRHPHTMVAASDSGAHVSQILESDIPAYLLGYWVRERQEFSWEQAIYMLTGHPADVCSIRDRGRLAPGRAADVVVFDPTSIGSTLPHIVHDLPDGSARLVRDGSGFETIVVNGVPTWKDGVPTGATPGQLLRS